MAPALKLIEKLAFPAPPPLSWDIWVVLHGMHTHMVLA